jgi:hypothetical protein
MRRGRRRTLEKEDGRTNERNARQPQSERSGIETDGDDCFLAIGDDDGEFDHAHTEHIGMRPHHDETHPGPYLEELLAVPRRLDEPAFVFGDNQKGVSFVSIIMFILHPDALSLNGSVMINQSINHVIYGFKIPKRFLEISSRDLTLLSILII